MKKETTLWDRIKKSKELLDTWPTQRRESALKEANLPLSFVERMVKSGGYIIRRNHD